MKTPISPEEAVAGIKDGASVMIGGFLLCGRPRRLVDALFDSGAKDLTIIANDADLPNNIIGKLITGGRVSRLVATHIGTNPDAGKALLEKAIDVKLVPQGSLAEQIRAAGVGLGGVLTKTGLGTLAEAQGQVLTLNGEKWLYLPPVSADFALIYANQADQLGNLAYHLTEHNFNPSMALAAKTVIVEAREIVPVGALSPDLIKTPGVVVDHLVTQG